MIVLAVYHHVVWRVGIAALDRAEMVEGWIDGFPETRYRGQIRGVNRFGRVCFGTCPPPADFCLVAVEGDDPPQGEIGHLGPAADPERQPGQGDHLGDVLLEDQTELAPLAQLLDSLLKLAPQPLVADLLDQLVDPGHGRTSYTGSQGASNATAAAARRP